MGLTVLIALIAGTELAGVAGALVAVPPLALIAVLMEEYLVQKDPHLAMSGKPENSDFVTSRIGLGFTLPGRYRAPKFTR